jgi:hypothetical protein
VTPPPVLDSAHVLRYAIVDESVTFTGKLHLYAGDQRVGAVPHLAICQDLHTNDLMLFHCDSEWDVIAVQAWNGPAAEPVSSTEEIVERAEQYYSGLSRRWVAHPASRDEALAYHEEQIGKDRCSFCNRSLHDARFLVEGSNDARICDLCIERLHGEIAQSPSGA